MGKGRSPGKWIKNLLLGKKSSSKSDSSKKSFKFSGNKDVLGSSEDSLVISAPISAANAINGVLSEKNRSSHDRDIPSTGDEEVARAQAVAQEDHENLKLTEAAITMQAACRGYQACQTYHMLKGGILQLQAHIRGHLVRRQAVSALHCVKGIVKIQALARGYIVRRSDVGLAVQKIRKGSQSSNSILVTSTHAEKLSESVFVQKLLVSSGHAVPLSLNCDPREPNLAWKWLDRWTNSHFWAPLPELKNKSVSDEKTGSGQTVKRKQVKRTTQKSPTVKADEGSISGPNKYKQHPKKDSNSPLLSAQEHSQKDIEKNGVKKSRQQNVSDRSEVVTEKRKHSTRKSSDHTVTNVPEQGPSVSSEKMKVLSVSKSGREKFLGHQEDKHDNEPKSLQKPSVQNVAIRTKSVGEKRNHITKKLSDLAVTDVSEQDTSAPTEEKKDLAVLKSKESDPDKGVGHQEDNHNREPTSPIKNCLQNVADISGVVNEQENNSVTEISDHTVTDVSEQCTSASLEKKKDLEVSNNKESCPEKILGQQEDKHHDEPDSSESTHLENVAYRSGVVNEKRKHSTRKSADHTVTDISDQGRHASSEKKKDLAVSKATESDPEKIPEQQEENHDNEANSPKKPVLQNFSEKSEVVNGKRKHSAEKIPDHTVTSEPGPNSSSEKKKVSTASKSKDSYPKKSVGQQAEDKHDYEPQNDPIPLLQTSLTNVDNEAIQGVGEDLNGGDISSISNNYQRRASLPANFNDQDNESHSTPRLPSYMAPTESAKAKLRAQGSPRFATDFVDKNSVTRRQSLSSSFNSKSGSFSPRAERLVAMSSRGVLRNDRSLSSSRDATDKLMQPQWRR